MSIDFNYIESEQFNREARAFARLPIPSKHAGAFGYVSPAMRRAAGRYLLDIAVRTERDVERILGRFKVLRNCDESGPSDLSTNYKSY